MNLNDLEVVSFHTDPAAENPRGTVHAQGWSEFTGYYQCQYATGYGTCQGTCVNTCGGPTCDAPCKSTNTFYQTCQAGCSWTYGAATCYELQSIRCD